MNDPLRRLFAQTFNSRTPLATESWRLWDSFEPYRFNYDGSAEPLPGEVNSISDSFIGFSLIERFICYAFCDNNTQISSTPHTIQEPILLLALSTTNAAHSLSELMSFLKFYLETRCCLKVGVNTIIQQRLPFLYELLTLFIPEAQILTLDSNIRYLIRKGWIRRNTHFNLVTNWNDIPFRKINDTLLFENLHHSALKFLEDPSFLTERCIEIGNNYRSHTPRNERIMLVKTREDSLSTTPDRAMILESAGTSFLKDNDIRVVSTNDFSCIEEYIWTLRNARVFITSYGGAACTNRFFLHPESRVILLANKSYQREYEYKVADGEYWHLRHSHLFPVREQIVILDHPDELAEDNLRRLVQLSE